MPELRRDPVVGRWVVFSPERLRRPNEYEFARPEPTKPEENPFLPGNEAFTPAEVFALRDEGTAPNTPGWRVRVVPNRFPALRVEGELDKEAVGFYDRMNGVGAHEVVVETPDPKLALEDQPLSGVVEVLTACRARMIDLAKDTRFRYILVFKNVGPLAGASLSHAHSQLIAVPVTPIVVKEKLQACRRYFEVKDRNIYNDILRNERKLGERLVYENAGFTAFCPFASRVPFELCILPRKQAADFHASSDHDLVLLGDVLKRVLKACQRGLGSPNYNLILHTAPLRHPRKDYWSTIDFDFRWHIEIVPRLTGIAGFELGTGFYINPTLPEEAARFLREVKTDD
jgi:UDPglucose--hexose-1-phosphate uridylyltransferase